MYVGEKELIDPYSGEELVTGKPLLRNCNLLLINGIDKERQIANLIFNMIAVGDTTLMPHYFREVGKAVYNENIKRWSFTNVIEGKF